MDRLPSAVLPSTVYPIFFIFAKKKLPKYLIIRFSSIGDIVLTTPVVRALKRQVGAEVHYLTKASFRNVLAANPYIDRIHSIRKSAGEVLPQLRAEGFDGIIDLHNNLRSQRVRWGLFPVPARGFNKLNLEKWLMVRFKINRLPDVHIVDRYLKAAAHLGVVNDGEGLDYFIPPADELETGVFIRSGAKERVGNPDLKPPEIPYTAFVIGAAHATKRLPPEKIAEFCRKIEGPVVLLGGPEDAETGQRVTQSAGGNVINACGRCNLNQSASLVRQARRVVTHDTGLMHIAAAFRKEIVSVWGNTIPEFGMYPFYPNGVNKNTTLEVKGLPCRPCSKIGYDVCPKGHFRCMMEQEWR